MDSVGATPRAGHLGYQFAAVVEKVHMPPPSLDGVVHCAKSLTLRTGKTFPWHVLESQLQTFGFTLKAALGYSPLPTQSKRCSKEFFGRHRFNFNRLQAETQIAALEPQPNP